MYDPESALEQRRILDELALKNEKQKEILGANHALIGIYEPFHKALEILNGMTEDYDNCFDEKRKQELAENIQEKLKELQSLNDTLNQVLKN